MHQVFDEEKGSTFFSSYRDYILFYHRIGKLIPTTKKPYSLVELKGNTTKKDQIFEAESLFKHVISLLDIIIS
jgi:hypothetical protein